MKGSPSSHDEWTLLDKQRGNRAHKSPLVPGAFSKGSPSPPPDGLLPFSIKSTFSLNHSSSLPPSFLSFSSLSAYSPFCLSSFPLALPPSFHSGLGKSTGFGVKIRFKSSLSLMFVSGVTFSNFHYILRSTSSCAQGATNVCLGWLL